MSVPRSVPTSRYGRLCPTNGSLFHTASCRSFDLSKQPIFRYMGILPGCCSGTFRLLSVSFLYGPTASWANGDTFCLCRPSNLRNVTVRKSLLFVCPADRFFTRPSRHTFYQMPFIQADGQFHFYLRLLPAVIPCLPPHRFYRVRM